MKSKRAAKRKAQNPSLVRASISFPPDLYETLEAIAKQKKVSLAWVVRDAADRYVADQTAEGRKGERETLQRRGGLRGR